MNYNYKNYEEPMKNEMASEKGPFVRLFLFKPLLNYSLGLLIQ